MIEKEFIPYEEALALKELGFDEPCFAIYVDKQLQINATYQNHLEFKGWVAAPTFSQAFRFFREKYNLIGGVEYIAGEKAETTWWDIYIVGHFNTNTSKMTMKYQPYEEAELACLRKLIEIAKEKNNEQQ